MRGLAVEECEVVEPYKDLMQVLTYLVLSKFMKMVVTFR